MKKNTTNQVTYGKAALGAALAGLALVATMGVTSVASTPSPALASDVQAGSTQAVQRTIQVSASDSVKASRVTSRWTTAGSPSGSRTGLRAYSPARVTSAFSAAAAMLAALPLLALAFRRKIEGSTRIPFGPFLALGFWMVWLYGPL